MAHSQLQRAQHTSGQRPAVFVAPDAEQMRLFGHFLVAIEDWNTVRSEASWSVKTFKQYYDLKIQMRKVCLCGCYMDTIS